MQKRWHKTDDVDARNRSMSAVLRELVVCKMKVASSARCAFSSRRMDSIDHKRYSFARHFAACVPSGVSSGANRSALTTKARFGFPRMQSSCFNRGPVARQIVGALVAVHVQTFLSADDSEAKYVLLSCARRDLQACIPFSIQVSID
jgi:hypothetical protein